MLAVAANHSVVLNWPEAFVLVAMIIVLALPIFVMIFLAIALGYWFKSK